MSFRMCFQKDIVPTTISSWIKQKVLLCYQLSDEEAQNLYQVRAHDVSAFAASKAFHGGVCLDQILSACHWKAHNTFTQFYLKDIAWADSELYHLGPVVAEQQIHIIYSVHIVFKKKIPLSFISGIPLRKVDPEAFWIVIREFANNVSQTPLAKIRNIINQYGRKPLRGTVLFANSV